MLSWKLVGEKKMGCVQWESAFISRAPGAKPSWALGGQHCYGDEERVPREPLVSPTLHEGSDRRMFFRELGFKLRPEGS